MIARLFAVEEELPAAKPRIRALAESLTPQRRAGDFAQAMMDLGATICTPKKPACALCPWMRVMRGAGARRSGELPAQGGRRRPARCAAVRRSSRVRADGFLLLRTRPEKGLLGGMTEVPTTEWHREFDDTTALGAAPLKAKWRRTLGVVTHTFTHFPLELAVYAASVPARTAAPAGMRWIPLSGCARRSAAQRDAQS